MIATLALATLALGLNASPPRPFIAQPLRPRTTSPALADDALSGTQFVPLRRINTASKWLVVAAQTSAVVRAP